MRFQKPLLLATLAATALVACDMSGVTDVLNVFKLKFASAGFDGPTINGPTLLEVADMLLPKTNIGGISLGGQGLSKTEVLGKYNLSMNFKVNADNSGNAERAQFGSSALKPVLLFRLNSETAQPCSVSVEPFSVSGGKVDSLKFPITIPLTAITSDIATKVLAGDSIPYFLSGIVKFNLMTPAGEIKSSDNAELHIVSDKVSTRPADGSGLSGSDLATLVGKLF